MLFRSTEKFTFFFHAASPFSQWYACEFKGVSPFENVDTADKVPREPRTFHNCEQWMMFNKALLFRDHASAKLIAETADPKACKALGRNVQNFDEKIWAKHNVGIIYEGNKLKFTQNGDLMKQLEETKGTTLVEASPFDRIYGIGLGATNPKALNRKTWRGKNLLGETLTKLREDLFKAK